MLRSTARCLMCDAALSDLQTLQKASSCSERCRRQYAALPPGRRCKVCGRRLSLRELVTGFCASLECRHKAGEPYREQYRQEQLACWRRAGELRDRHAERLAIVEPESYLPTIIPSFRRPITNLPERRRRDFRDHLNRLISEACESRASSPPSDAGAPAEPVSPSARELEFRAVLGKACVLCTGLCCGYAGNHAYLTAARIRRYMAEHPDRRPRDVLAAYLSHVGNRTVANSCVYHRSDGCSLPREMRANVCNEYYCYGLTRFLQDRTVEHPPRAFFVSMSGDEVRAAAFCDEDSSRTVDPSAAAE